jgi:hypothetical protein
MVWLAEKAIAELAKCHIRDQNATNSDKSADAWRTPQGSTLRRASDESKSGYFQSIPGLGRGSWRSLRKRLDTLSAGLPGIAICRRVHPERNA